MRFLIVDDQQKWKIISIVIWELSQSMSINSFFLLKFFVPKSPLMKKALDLGKIFFYTNFSISSATLYQKKYRNISKTIKIIPAKCVKNICLLISTYVPIFWFCSLIFLLGIQMHIDHHCIWLNWLYFFI